MILTYTILLRINIGGLHMKHYTSCLLASFIYCFAIVYITEIIKNSLTHMFLINCLCVIIIYCLAPVIPIERKEVNITPSTQMKKRALFIIISCNIIFQVFNSSYLAYIQWATILQTLLIILSKRRAYDEKIYLVLLAKHYLH